ncbi:MAG: DUF1565 domain-containing protein [Deltaproteobacteria bacterium]|nr:DUF1565 domain-containing protein [Deltaproteobacteria bacterium]
MKRLVLVVSCFLVLALGGSGWADVWYVKPDGSDFNDGQSWATAVQSVQSAINLAGEGDEVWIAAGTYQLQTYVYVSKAVAIYGGFNGTETEREQRDWAKNVTTLDGNQKTLCFYVTADATIDGLTIINGYSLSNGGGIRNYRSSPSISNCTFHQNKSGYHGGGIVNYYYASPTITNCSFYGNEANYDGGGIYNFIWSSPTIVNSTFHGNAANRYGGAMYNYYYSSPTVTNCTFFENTAGASGGGMYNDAYSSPVVTNTILWGDTAPADGEIHAGATSYPDVAYSDIQGGYSGLGNIDADPGFLDPENGDFHLAAESVCIDVGDPEAPSLPETDFEGDPRIVGDMPDMGVDEFVPVQEEGGLGAYVLYGDEMVRLRGIADSKGNVGSNQKITITRGCSGILEGDLTALDKIRVMGSITIDGDVLTNDEVRVYKHAKLNVTGTVTEGEEAGLSAIDLPELDFSAGGENIRVKRNHTLNLPEGSYGTVRVKRGATLRLSSGVYNMRRLYLYRGATLSVDLSGGPVTINVVKRLRIGMRARVNIESGSTRDVTFNVLGSTGRCRRDRIRIAPFAEFRGTLVAPRSRVRLGFRSELEGAVYAKRIYVSWRARFNPHAD